MLLPGCWVEMDSELVASSSYEFAFEFANALCQVLWYLIMMPTRA
jgi:hypothetical protein